MSRQNERKIKMTGSNAKVLTPEENKIRVTVRRKRDSLIMQKLAGAAMLIFIAVSVPVGGSASASVILAPMALAAMFSKQKLMDFGIFERKQ